jgi:hypothetical protein
LVEVGVVPDHRAVNRAADNMVPGLTGTFATRFIEYDLFTFSGKRHDNTHQCRAIHHVIDRFLGGLPRPFRIGTTGTGLEGHKGFGHRHGFYYFTIY